VAELEAYAAMYARAPAADPQAAERLASVLSWLRMLGAAGGDGAVADLFVEFAREDRDGVA
jgi:hypothetical protein